MRRGYTFHEEGYFSRGGGIPFRKRGFISGSDIVLARGDYFLSGGGIH